MRGCWHNNLDILGLVHVYTSLPDNSSELLEGLHCLFPKNNYVFTSRLGMLEFTSPEVLESMQFLILSTTETIVHACAAFKTQQKHVRWEFPSWFCHLQRIYSAPFGLHHYYQESDTGIIIPPAMQTIFLSLILFSHFYSKFFLTVFTQCSKEINSLLPFHVSPLQPT